MPVSVICSGQLIKCTNIRISMPDSQCIAQRFDRQFSLYHLHLARSLPFITIIEPVRVLLQLRLNGNAHSIPSIIAPLYLIYRYENQYSSKLLPCLFIAPDVHDVRPVSDGRRTTGQDEDAPSSRLSLASNNALINSAFQLNHEISRRRHPRTSHIREHGAREFSRVQ